MHLLLLGPPGAGKGTQAELIARDYRLPHISTGDMLREAMAAATPLGLQAQTYMQAGQLVPDEVVNGIVRERLGQADAREGFLLDGFPRTLPQAEALEQILAELGLELDAVIAVESAPEVILRRLTERRVCRECKAIYHLTNKPPRQDDRCDLCGGEVYQRADDQPETVRERLMVYTRQTEPLLAYYRRKGLLHRVNGDLSIEGTYAEIKEVLAQIGAGEA